MLFLLVFQQGECVAEFVMQFIRTVAHHRQTAALQRTVFGKSGNDDIPSGLDRIEYGTHVGVALFLRRQEVEHRAVMPDVVTLAGQVDFGDVRLDPAHLALLRAQTLARREQRGRG